MRPEEQIADLDAEIAFLWQMRRNLQKAMRVAEHNRRERDKRVAERRREYNTEVATRVDAGLEPPTLASYEAVFDALEANGKIRDVRGMTRSERGLLRRMANRRLVFLSTSGVWVVETHADLRGFRAEVEREYNRRVEKA